MKTLKIVLLPILFALSSCYIYKPYEFKEMAEVPQTSGASKSSSVRSQNAEKNSIKNSKTTPQSKEEETMKRRNLESQKTKANSNFTRSNGEIAMTPAMENKKAERREIEPVGTDLDSIKIKIHPTKYYKITAEGNQYKIQADKWEGDTLVSHILRKPEKVLRFHKDQIDEEALMERRFSKPYSDIITVGAYVVGGVAVLLLIM